MTHKFDNFQYSTFPDQSPLKTFRQILFSPAIQNLNMCRYAEHGIGDHNYCRNPTDKYSDVWCYTTSTTKRWDWCDVPSCGK